METKLTRFLQKTTEYLVYLFVFILPWQVKLILRPSEASYSEISLSLSLAMLVAILFLFLWFRLKQNNGEAEYRPLIFSLAALGLFIFISIFFASDKPLAFFRYFIYLAAFSLFFVIRSGLAKQSYQEPFLDKIYLIYSLLFSLLLQSCLGIYQFFSQQAYAFKYLGLAAHDPSTLGVAVIEAASGRWLRAYGGMDHPNILGGVLAISLIFAAYLLAKKKVITTSRDMLSSGFLFLFYFVSLFALFFTFSRSAWLALAAGLITLLIIFIINKDKWVLGRFIALIFFSAVLVCVAAAPYQDLLLVRTQGETRLEQKSISDRITYINEAKNQIQTHLLTGVGVGNYTTELIKIDNNKKAVWDYQPVHNVFLLLWAECGLFSLLSFLVFLYFLIRFSRREILALAIFFPIIILMLFDHWLISLPFGVVFLFLLLGLI